MSAQAAIIPPMLKRSNDRKVANAVSPNGKTPTIANRIVCAIAGIDIVH